MEQFSSKFLDHLKFEKRYSSHTIVSYTLDLTQFSAFLKTLSIDSVDKIENTDIRSWIMSLMDKGLSSTSVNRKISTIKRFFHFLLSEGVLKVNPSLKITAPKLSKKLPLFIPENNLVSQLDAVEVSDSFEGLRDQLIIETLYVTGIRLSELIQLQHNGVDLFNQQIKVLGKRNKERIIPVAGTFTNLIKAYFDKKKESGLSLHGYVFVRANGQPMYSKQVYNLVRGFLNGVTTLQRKSPHVLRHTFATHMLNNGADLNAIKELLGHSSLASTQVYTHNSIEKLKSTYKQAHPKA